MSFTLKKCLKVGVRSKGCGCREHSPCRILEPEDDERGHEPTAAARVFGPPFICCFWAINGSRFQKFELLSTQRRNLLFHFPFKP